MTKDSFCDILVRCVESDSTLIRYFLLPSVMPVDSPKWANFAKTMNISKQQLLANYGITIVALITLITNSILPGFAKAAPAKQTEVVMRESVEGNMFPRTTAENRIGNADMVVKAVITAYTSTPDQTDDTPFIAATGKRVHDGMIAANWLPFGTKVKIPSLYGNKIFVVEDRMNSRYGFGRMDIWFDSSKGEARKFGVKRVNIEVYYTKKVSKEIAKK